MHIVIAGNEPAIFASVTCLDRRVGLCGAIADWRLSCDKLLSVAMSSSSCCQACLHRTSVGFIHLGHFCSDGDAETNTHWLMKMNSAQFPHVWKCLGHNTTSWSIIRLNVEVRTNYIWCLLLLGNSVFICILTWTLHGIQFRIFTHYLTLQGSMSHIILD